MKTWSPGAFLVATHTVACGAVACGATQTPEPHPIDQAAPVVAPPPPATTAAPSRMLEPTCAADVGKTPVCDGPCAPNVLWVREHGRREGFLPALHHIASSADGSIVVSGITGKGPTYLGGEALYTGWPRGLGNAFVASYGPRGEHEWSRQLLANKTSQARGGARSGVRSMALTPDGSVRVFATRIHADRSTAYLITLSREGNIESELRLAPGLPALVQLTDVGGAAVALGARDSETTPDSIDVLETRIEPSGELQSQVRATVPHPAGTIGSQHAMWHPLGVLWTATLTPGRTGEHAIGGTLLCPTGDEKGSTEHACPWYRTELVVAGVPLDGRAPWYRAFPIANYESSGSNAAADASGNTYVAGTFTGMVRFGAVALCATPLPKSYERARAAGGPIDTPCRCVRDYADAFLVKLDSAGEPLWARRIGGALEDRAGPVVVDGAGNAVVAIATSHVSASGASLLWSLYGYAPNGTHLWTRPLIGPTAPLLAVAPSGAVLVAEANTSPPGVRLMSIEASAARVAPPSPASSAP